MSVGMKDDCLSSVIWKIVTEEEKKERDQNDERREEERHNEKWNKRRTMNS